MACKTLSTENSLYKIYKFYKKALNKSLLYFYI